MTQTRAKTKSPAFIHLRVHTAYSLLEGALQIKDLPQTCRKMAMPALAITDTNNMFGALEFAEVLGNSGIPTHHRLSNGFTHGYHANGGADCR